MRKVGINWINPPSAVLRSNHVKKAVSREVKKEVDTIQRQVLKEMLFDYHLIWLLALRDAEAFGSTRLARVMDKVLVLSEDIGAGRLDFDDIKNALADELTEEFSKKYLGIEKEK